MKHILSVQSHVAYGHVGNMAAVFPLQRLGFEVWPVNTVQFSNHTGYGVWTGQVFTPEHIADVIEGIAARGALGRCDAVLSGYMGDATLGRIVVDTVTRIRQENPKALYCCDPVMGDVDRGIFVRPGIPEFLKEHAVPNADIITPNQFELEHLTGVATDTLEHALAAADTVRALGPKLVLITSLIRRETPVDTIEMLLVSDDGAWLVGTPRLPIDPAPNGAGDAVAALFLGSYLETGNSATALEHAAAAIFAVFDATHRAKTRELQLVVAQNDLVQPARTFPSQQVR